MYSVAGKNRHCFSRLGGAGEAGDFFGKKVVDFERNGMIRRINGDISGSSGLTRRSGDVFRENRRERIVGDSKNPRKSGHRVNSSKPEPSVVEVSRVWDTANGKPRGRYDAYNQFDQAPLGLYVDAYA